MAVAGSLVITAGAASEDEEKQVGLPEINVGAENSEIGVGVAGVINI